MDTLREEMHRAMVERIVEYPEVLLTLDGDTLLELYKHTMTELEKVNGVWQKKENNHE